MKTISLLQPWARLVVMGAKRIETRSWNTKYRGELLIHASLGKKPVGRQIAALANRFGIKKPAFDDLPFGAIIGKVNLKDCVIITEVKTEWDIADSQMYNGPGLYTVPPSEPELSFGNYQPGRYAWLLSDHVQFAKPIPAKGALGLWEFDMTESNKKV